MAVCASIHREMRSLVLIACLLLASVISNVSSFSLPRIFRQNRLYSSVADDESVHNNEGKQSTASSAKRRKKKPRLPEKNLYDILGANQSMSRQDIKRQYITLAKEYHPDSAGPEYVDRFDEIARAWDVLSDSTARRAYDRELAAEKFKEDIVQKASAVANEYGPSARAFYEDFALPFLRRTATTTMAGWSVITDEGERPRSNAANVDSNNDVASTPPPPADFGETFQRVMEASRNATRQIDAAELAEESEELRLRADEARAESVEVLERLSAIKSERLHLTFHTQSAEFTSEEALQFLDGFNDLDKQTLIDRMTFRNPITNDIDAFSAAERELEQKENEQLELDREMQAREEALEEAEHQAKFALMEEERILQMLEEARQNVLDTQQMVADAQLSITGLNPSVRIAEQNLAKTRNAVKRKRDVVRKALRRKEEKDGTASNETRRSRDSPFSAFRRSSMSDLGFEQRNLAKIEELKNEENSVEGDFLRLVELTSKLVSRSETLRIRSEELIGRDNVVSDRDIYEDEDDMFAYESDAYEYGQGMQP